MTTSALNTLHSLILIFAWVTFLFFSVWYFLFLQQDVEKFTDIEKLYLYLKLPSGPSSGNDKRYVSDALFITGFSTLLFGLFVSHTCVCFVMALITLLALLSYCLSEIQAIIHRLLCGHSLGWQLRKNLIEFSRFFLFQKCDLFCGVFGHKMIINLFGCMVDYHYEANHWSM